MLEPQLYTPLRDARGIHRVVDLRMGIVGALFMGGLVFAVNAPHGWMGATTAALKQGAYTLCAGGFLLRTCENLALGMRNRRLALALALVVPSTISIALTYAVHQMRGTPAPLHSVLPTLLLAPPSFLAWGWRKRRNRDATVIT